jgi:hypothetical protein
LPRALRATLGEDTILPRAARRLSAKENFAESGTGRSAKDTFAESLAVTLGKAFKIFSHFDLKLFLCCSCIILNKIWKFGQLLKLIAIFSKLMSFHQISWDNSI